MILLQNAESQRRMYEHKCDDMAQRLRESDHALGTLHKELDRYQVSCYSANLTITLRQKPPGNAQKNRVGNEEVI